MVSLPLNYSVNGVKRDRLEFYSVELGRAFNDSELMTLLSALKLSDNTTIYIH